MRVGSGRDGAGRDCGRSTSGFRLGGVVGGGLVRVGLLEGFVESFPVSCVGCLVGCPDGCLVGVEVGEGTRAGGVALGLGSMRDGSRVGVLVGRDGVAGGTGRLGAGFTDSREGVDGFGGAALGRDGVGFSMSRGCVGAPVGALVGWLLGCFVGAPGEPPCSLGGAAQSGCAHKATATTVADTMPDRAEAVPGGHRLVMIARTAESGRSPGGRLRICRSFRSLLHGDKDRLCQQSTRVPATGGGTSAGAAASFQIEQESACFLVREADGNSGVRGIHRGTAKPLGSRSNRGHCVVMKIHPSSLRVFAAGAALTVSGLALADYSTDPLAPLVVQATATDDVQPKVVDGGGGSHYISFLSGSGYDVMLARLDAAGKSAWNGPVLVNDRALSSTVDYGLASDASGNAYVAYATTAGVIQCTSVAADGTIRWTKALSAAVGNNPAQVTVASDGFVWVAFISGSGTAVQRLAPGDGALSFATPVQLSEAGASQFVADIEASENGAVIVSCVRYTTFTGPKILRAHRIDPKGTRPWAAAGVSVFTTGSLQFGNFPRFIGDGAGGGYFAWYTTGPLQCWLQRVTAAGALMYGTNGVPVTLSSTGAERTDPWVHLGNDGRVYVSFTQHTPNSSIYGIYAQCFSKGARQWGDSAAAIQPLGTTYSYGWARIFNAGDTIVATYNNTPSAVQDNMVGAVLAGDGSVTSRFDVALNSGVKYRYDTAAASADGAVIAWQGGPTTGASDIFAARLNSDGSIGPPSDGVFGDLNGDGVVTAQDLGILLDQWGGPGSADIVPNGIVDAQDLAALLAAWTN